MSILHVSLGFASLPDAELDAFTENVLAGLKENPKYPTPAPPLVQVEDALATFTTALSAAALGGQAATAAKDAAREALQALLRPLALYVQLTANNDMATLLSSGFEASSTSRTRTPLEQPTILTVTNGESKKLKLNVTPLTNARAYEAQQRVGTGAWSASVVCTRARGIEFTDLAPGTLYTFQVRGVGGSTGFSPWSDPVSHMAT